LRAPQDDLRTLAPRLDQHIDSLVTASARPFHEAVPANAESVLFRDEAELIACLARDWLNGTTAWWWVTLFGTSPGDAVVRALVNGARAVPAALELLARSGRACEFVRALP